MCFRAAEGGAFAQLQAEIQSLLDADDGPKVEVTRDEYGYTWLVSTTSPPDISALVTDLHAVNSTLQDHGFGPQLLCSLVGFADDRDVVSAWSTCTSAGRSIPSRRSTGSGATTPWSCRCVACSRAIYASKPSYPAGSPSGEHPGSRSQA